MIYITHYELKPAQMGLYQRGEGTIHGTEFGGDPEMFVSEEYALDDFRDWLLDCYPDGVEIDESFVGWGVVFRCKTVNGEDKLISVDLEASNDQ